MPGRGRLARDGYLMAATTGRELTAAAAVLARRTWRAPLPASIIGAQVAAAVMGLPAVLLAHDLTGPPRAQNQLQHSARPTA